MLAQGNRESKKVLVSIGNDLTLQSKKDKEERLFCIFSCQQASLIGNHITLKKTDIPRLSVKAFG